jgi:arylsulfatase A-like enzyme
LVVVEWMLIAGARGSPVLSALVCSAFDELVGRGVLFLGDRTSAGYPLLSHLGLLTGRLPVAHDVTAVRDFAAAVPTLATLLRAEGYLTGGVVRAGLVPPHVDLARGFHEYREYATPPRDEAERRRMFGTEDARSLLGEAARWVRRTAPAEPFFLYVHLGASWFSGHDLRRYRASDRRRYLSRFYDRRMRGVDVALGEFFDEIDRLGVEPVLLFTSDDGQTAFARFVGRPDGEGRGPVPLVVAGPGIPPGARVVEPVRSTHVVPLLLDLVGIDPPPGLSHPPVLPSPR